MREASEQALHLQSVYISLLYVSSISYIFSFLHTDIV